MKTDLSKRIPIIAGEWSITGKLLEYISPDQENIDLFNPETVSFPRVVIEQNGRFFTYDPLDGRLPKLGVFEPIYLDGKLKGWKAYTVDTRTDDEILILNFTKICKCGKVKEFDITYIESGFSTDSTADQRPRVEYATATRIN